MFCYCILNTFHCIFHLKINPIHSFVMVHDLLSFKIIPVLFMTGSIILTSSPVPYVTKKLSFKFFGDLQNYKFLESLEPTEPEK